MQPSALTRYPNETSWRRPLLSPTRPPRFPRGLAAAILAAARAEDFDLGTREALLAANTRPVPNGAGVRVDYPSAATFDYDWTLNELAAGG